MTKKEMAVVLDVLTALKGVCDHEHAADYSALLAKFIGAAQAHQREMPEHEHGREAHHG